MQARIKKWLIIAASVFSGLLLLYVSVGFLVVGPVARDILAEELSTALKRSATVEEVRFNPLTLRTRIAGVRFEEKNGEAEFVGFDLLDVRPSLRSLVNLAPVIADLRLVNPRFSFSFFGKGKFSFSDLIPQTDDGEPAEPSSAPVIPFRVDNFSLENGMVTFTDQPHETTHVVDQINLSIPLASSLEKHRDTFIQPSFSARVNGEPLRLEGKTKPFEKTLRTEFTLALDEVNLPQYWQYVPFDMPLELRSGTFASQIVFVFDRPDGQRMNISVSGTASLNNVALDAPDMQQVAGFESLNVIVGGFSLSRHTMDVNSVSLDGLYGIVERKADGSINWMQYMPPAVRRQKTQDAQKDSASPSAKQDSGITAGSNETSQSGATESGGADAAAKVAAATADQNGDAVVDAEAGPEKKHEQNGQEDDEGARFIVNVSKASLRNARLEYRDRFVEGGFSKTISPIEITVSDFSTARNAQGTAVVRIGDGERLDVDGTFSAFPVRFAMDASVTGVNVADYSAFYGQYLPLVVDSGRLGCMFSVKGGQQSEKTTSDTPEARSGELAERDTFELTEQGVEESGSGPHPAEAATAEDNDSSDDSLKISVHGIEVSLSKLALRKPVNQTPSVSLETFAISGGEVDLASRRVAVERVMLSKPFARLINYESGLDLLVAFTESQQSGSSADANGSAGSDGGVVNPPDDTAEVNNGPAPQSLAGQQNAPLDTGSAAQKQGSWEVEIGDISLLDGTVDYYERHFADNSRQVLSGINVTLTDVTTDAGGNIPFRLNAVVNGSGTVDVSGDIRPKPVAVSAGIKLRGIEVAPFDPYLARYADMLLAGGDITADIRAAYQAGDSGGQASDSSSSSSSSGRADDASETAGGYSARGDVSVSGLRVLDAADSSPFVGFDGFAVKQFVVSSSGSRLYVQELELNAPHADFSIAKNGVLNLNRMLGVSAKAQSEQDKAGQIHGDDSAGAVAKATLPDVDIEATAKTDDGDSETLTTNGDGSETVAYKSPLPFDEVKVDRVRINSGRVGFSDASVSPAYSTAVTDISVRLDGLSLDPASRPELDVSAKLDNHSLSLAGVVNPLIQPMYSDLTFTLNGLDLVPLSPYAVQFVAYPVQKGRLYADVAFKTEEWVLDAKNKFFVEQLLLGDKDKRPDAPSVPIKLGLALLQDSNGNMEIDLPVRGRLDDPQFRIGGIVFKAFINLIFKVVASPFALIGNIVEGASGEDLQFATFDPGASVVNSAMAEKLDTVADALKKRPKLKLEINAYTDAEKDTAALIKNGVQTMLQQAKYAELSRSERAATTPEQLTVTPEEYQEILTEAYEAVPEMENDPRPGGLFGFDEQPVEVMEQFLRSQIVVTPDTLSALALERVRNVQNYLLEKNPDLGPRVFLGNAGGTPKQRTGVPEHRVELGIK